MKISLTCSSFGAENSKLMIQILLVRQFMLGWRKTVLVLGTAAESS
jgi:hypothetical protein